MTPEQFCYWLQGRLEMSKEPLTPKETQIIRDHLATVFTKVTPAYDDLLKSLEKKPLTPSWTITCDGADYGRPLGDRKLIC